MSTAPRQIEDGFASSPANIDRDHGVGYERALDLLDRAQVAQLELSVLDRHRPLPVRVGNPDVDRLDELGRPEVGGEPRVDARARDVQLAVVGRNLGAGRLEHLAVPNRPVADARSSL